MGATKRRLDAEPAPEVTAARQERDALNFLGRAHRRRRRLPPPGSAPGVLVAPSEGSDTTAIAISYDAERIEEHEIACEACRPPVPDAPGVLWIDVEGTGDRDALERVREAFGIHPLVIADVVHVPQRPKTEEYEGHQLIVTQMVSLGPKGEIEIEQVSFVLGQNWLVTFGECPGDVFDPVRARLRTPGAKIRQLGADYLAYALIDAIIDGYFPVVESLGEVLEELENEVISSTNTGTLTRIHTVRNMLLHLGRIQRRQRDTIAALLRDDSSPFSEPVKLFLRDAHDHALQSLDAIETYRDLAVGLMDVYLSVTSNRMNEIMKTLTVMASIFIPLTFIVGVYGMNFRYMPELEWRYGYPAVWALMVAIAVGLLAWFRWRGWVGKG